MLSSVPRPSLLGPRDRLFWGVLTGRSFLVIIALHVRSHSKFVARDKHNLAVEESWLSAEWRRGGGLTGEQLVCSMRDRL